MSRGIILLEIGLNGAKTAIGWSVADLISVPNCTPLQSEHISKSLPPPPAARYSGGGGGGLEVKFDLVRSALTYQKHTPLYTWKYQPAHLRSLYGKLPTPNPLQGSRSLVLGLCHNSPSLGGGSRKGG